jgi:hypothetical protein
MSDANRISSSGGILWIEGSPLNRCADFEMTDPAMIQFKPLQNGIVSGLSVQACGFHAQSFGQSMGLSRREPDKEKHYDQIVRVQLIPFCPQGVGGSRI